MPVRRIATAPEPTDKARVQQLVLEHMRKHPDELLPAALATQAALHGVPLTAPAPWSPAAMVALAAGICVIKRAREWVESVPPFSKQRAERCIKLVDVVLPSATQDLDARLTAEVKDKQRCSMEKLQEFDLAAHRAAREPVVSHFLNGVLSRGRPAAADDAAQQKRDTAVDTAYSALCRGRNPRWMCPIALMLLVVTTYTRSTAVLALLSALCIGAPSPSYVRDLVQRCKVPTAAAEAAQLRRWWHMALIFIIDNIGHYKQHVSYSSGAPATVQVHGARTVTAVAGYDNGVQHKAHLAPPLWPAAATVCPTDGSYKTLAEENRMTAHIEAELEEVLAAVILEERVNDGLESGECPHDPVGAATFSGAPGAVMCPAIGCNTYFAKQGNRKYCPICRQPLVPVAADAAAASAAHTAAPAGADDDDMGDAAATVAPAPPRNACKSARRYDGQVADDGRASLRFRKAYAAANGVRSFLNPGKELLIGVAARIRRVIVRTLACQEANPGKEEAQLEFLDRVVETSGLKTGHRSAVVVSGDMSTGYLMRKVLRNCVNIYFVCIFFIHGYLHEHMHMIKAFHRLSGPLTRAISRRTSAAPRRTPRRRSRVASCRNTPPSTP
jgi:hypothetical protein